jgi:hypothetical protein
MLIFEKHVVEGGYLKIECLLLEILRLEFIQKERSNAHVALGSIS